MNKMSKFWRVNEQYSENSQQYCIIYFKVSKRLDLKYPYHRKEMII